MYKNLHRAVFQGTLEEIIKQRVIQQMWRLLFMTVYTTCSHWSHLRLKPSCCLHSGIKTQIHGSFIAAGTSPHHSNTCFCASAKLPGHLWSGQFFSQDSLNTNCYIKMYLMKTVCCHCIKINSFPTLSVLSKLFRLKSSFSLWSISLLSSLR